LGVDGLEGLLKRRENQMRRKNRSLRLPGQIKQHDKLKESESKLKVCFLMRPPFPNQSSRTSTGFGWASVLARPTPESFEAYFNQFGELGLGEGGESEAELAEFLESMMGKLMSKDVLYEPLKEPRCWG